MSIETGIYAAFAIGVPLAVLGYLSYLKGTSFKLQTEGKRKRPIERNAA